MVSVSLSDLRKSALTQVQNKMLEQRSGTVTQSVILAQIQKEGITSKKRKKKLQKTKGKNIQDVINVFNDAPVKAAVLPVTQTPVSSAILPDFKQFIIPAALIGGIWLLSKKR